MFLSLHSRALLVGRYSNSHGIWRKPKIWIAVYLLLSPSFSFCSRSNTGLVESSWIKKSDWAQALEMEIAFFHEEAMAGWVHDRSHRQYLTAGLWQVLAVSGKVDIVIGSISPSAAASTNVVDLSDSAASAHP
jgi:hypothetical protein